MMTDERARLIGELGDASPLLEHLDRTVVEVWASPDHAALALALCNLVRRTTPRVAIVVEGKDVPQRVPFFGTGTIIDLARRQATAPEQSARASVRVGVGTITPGADLYVSSDGWNVIIGTEPHEALAGTGPGVLAAASLAAAEVFKRVVPRFPGWILHDHQIEWNLVNYELRTVDATAHSDEINGVLFGAGSVGSSLLHGLILSDAVGTIDVVDPDALEPRNHHRYPALLGDMTGPKSIWVEGFAAGELMIRGHEAEAADFIFELDRPLELAIAAVDNADARRDIATCLARTTLNAGVDGLKFHVSRHSFNDSLACVYCPYVDSAPALDEPAVFAQMTGLTRARVVELLHGDAINEEDLDVMGATKSVGSDNFEDLVGAPFDARARARLYAETSVGPHDAEVAVSAPFVSAAAGAILAAEALKASNGHPQGVDRRVDLDMAGLPTGLQRRDAQDQTGRCICRDTFYRQRFAEMWPDAHARDGG